MAAEIIMLLVQICWQSRLTGYQGCGEPIKMYDPDSFVESLNERMPELYHWYRIVKE